jgi:hypothetical protein
MKKAFTLLFLSLGYLSTVAQDGGLHFDGIDDYVSVPESASMPTTAMTVEMWFNPTPTGYATVLISKGQTSTSSYFAVFCSSSDFINTLAWTAGSFLTFDLFTSAGGDRLSYQLPSTIAGTWHHLAVTYNGAEKRIYLDGVLVGQRAFSGTILTNVGSPFVIGGLLPGTGNSYNGTTDEVRIWNIARTQAEIASSLSTEIPSNTAGLTTYYKFNQGTPGGNNAGITTVSDAAATPDADNGTLNNFALTGSTSNWVSGYSGLTVLPIRFASFSAGKNGRGVNLQWKTSLQRDVLSFEIERSADGRNFTRIGSVPARLNGGDEQSYQYLDQLPLPGINHYRLKAVKNSAAFTYGTTLTVRMNAVARLGVYPNPSTDVLHLQVEQRGNFTVHIQDAAMRVVKTIHLSSNGSSLVTVIDITSLQKGIYFLHAGDDVVPFVKQ